MTWLTKGAAAVSGLAVLGTTVGGVAQAGAPASSTEVIVRTEAGRSAEAERVALALGGRIEQRFAVIDGFVATVPTGMLDDLAGDPSVASVIADREVRLAQTATPYDAAADANSMYRLVQSLGVDDLWRQGMTGQGVDVAVIDSGVAPVRGLDARGKVLHGPDLSPEAADPDTRHLDTYGHGTFMAGLIGARDGDPAAPSTNGYLGIAPDSRIVSVKVADAHGATDVSQVLAAIDWVVQYRRYNGLNIRVLNLSFATDSNQPYTIDPLAHAVEVAWRYGIVVVTAAGNHGDTLGRLALPASDPFVLAVGALDTKGTVDPSDDDVASFSATGDGRRDPDVLAPGRSIQGLRVPGSYVDLTYGATANLNDRFLRGSGTSQATAIVSGLVALMLEDRPSLQPDQVKQALTSTSDEVRGEKAKAKGERAQGHGAVDISSAVKTHVGRVYQRYVMAQGGGSLQASRGSGRVTLRGRRLYGERDLRGRWFDASGHADDLIGGQVWSGSTWSGSTWSGSTWSGSTWSGSTWSGSTWSSAKWTGSTWSGSTWSGSTWSGLEYTSALGESPLSGVTWD